MIFAGLGKNKRKTCCDEPYTRHSFSHSQKEFRQAFHVFKFIHFGIADTTLAFLTTTFGDFGHHGFNITIPINIFKVNRWIIIYNVSNFISKRPRHKAPMLKDTTDIVKFSQSTKAKKIVVAEKILICVRIYPATIK